MMISKEELDKLLETYKAQPVGNGYIDVIVRRENVRPLVENLIKAGISIYRIDWWEYVDSLNKSPEIGHGGPHSRYYEGWFSEFCFDDDLIDQKHQNEVDEIIKVIENKVIKHYEKGTVSYKEEEYLTAALWLDVPDDWKSR